MVQDGSARPLTSSIARMRLENYRSVRHAVVDLGRLTYLVGPNGAGKSNVLDALRLMSEALTSSLEQALRERGGYDEVRRRGLHKNGTLLIELDLHLDGASATYSLEIGRGITSFSVVREECRVAPHHGGGGVWFRVTRGEVSSSDLELPAPPPGRLYLVTAANLPAFTPVFDALRGMAVYNLNPAAIRSLQPPTPGEVLERDGSNAASVLRRMAEVAAAAKASVEDYLAVIVPGVSEVDSEQIGTRETLRFTQQFAKLNRPARFSAESMSDGTLRAVGVLLAAFQPGPVTVVGVEEPEAAVHPAAAAVLRDALREASTVRQIVVTTHSPELLDDPELDPAAVLAVESVGGETVIARLEPAGLSALRDGLYTAGELLRVGQLLPETDSQ